VEDAASSAGIELNQLELEIEEHALHWRGDIEPTLEHLNQLGVRIAIDRFGTGLTSLSALSHLPIATIKIDESIVGNVSQDADVANYARAMIDAARLMGIDVVAVGVTSKETETFFERSGCWTFQRQTVTVDRQAARANSSVEQERNPKWLLFNWNSGAVEPTNQNQRTLW
jgi:EAL domain-containing protein (putative c-di-GMP-specific phosphodiesterase class I)